MRISDWSSDVCSSDLYFQGLFATALEPGELITAVHFPVPKRAAYVKFEQPASLFALIGVFVAQFDDNVRVAITGGGNGDRKSVVKGKSVSVRVDLGGRRIIKTKKHKNIENRI